MGNDKINQILTHLVGAASAAADGVTDAVQQAGKTVGAKYDVVKLNYEINRLQEDQKKIFSDIGHTMFMVKSGAFNQTDEDEQVFDAQQTIDKLLILADQKQQEIDFTADRLFKMNGSRICPVCGKVSSSKDIFCSACGTKLSDSED